MTDEFNPEAVVEAVARAMCQVRCGPNEFPDDPAVIPSPDHLRGFRTGKAWELFRIDALVHIKAHLALKNALEAAARI